MVPAGVWLQMIDRVPGESSPLRLLIVDDHPIVRDGLRGVFDGEDGFEVVGEASDGAQALLRRRSRDPTWS